MISFIQKSEISKKLNAQKQLESPEFAGRQIVFQFMKVRYSLAWTNHLPRLKKKVYSLGPPVVSFYQKFFRILKAFSPSLNYAQRAECLPYLN